MSWGLNCKHKLVCTESLAKFMEYWTNSLSIFAIDLALRPSGGLMYSSCRM